MINRFSKPVDVNIRETQVLPDIGFMTNQLEKRQAKYDANAQGLSTFQGELSKLQGVGEYAQKYIAGVDDKFKVMSQELLTRDLGDSRVANQVRDEVMSIKNDPELNKHIMAKKAYDTFQEEVAKVSKDGEIPPENLYAYQKLWGQYSKTGEFHGALQNPVILKGVDEIKEGKAIFDLMKVNGSDSIAYLAAEGGSIAYKNGWKGINGKQVSDAVKDNLNILFNSNVAKQWGRRYDMLADSKQAPKGLTKEQFIINNFLGIGKQYIHQDTSTNIDVAMREARTEKNKKKEDTGFILESESFKSGVYGGGFEFDEAGMPKGSGKGLGQLVSESSDPIDFFKKVWNNNSLSPEDLAKAETQNLLIGAKLANVTPKQFYDMTAKDRTVEFRAFNKDSQAQDLSNRLLDGTSGLLANLQMINKDGKKGPAIEILGEEFGLGKDATIGEINDYLSKNQSKVKAMGYASPNQHTKFGIMLSVNGRNLLADIAPYAERNLNRKELVKMEVEYAAAQALSGRVSSIPAQLVGGKAGEHIYFHIDPKKISKDNPTGLSKLTEQEYKQRIK